MGGACSTHDTRNGYSVLVGKSEGKRSLGRTRHRCEGNIRMDLREMGWKNVDWIHLAQDKKTVEGSCKHGTEPSGCVKGG